LLDAPLTGDAQPAAGVLREAVNVAPAVGPGGAEKGALAFDGTTSKAVYTLAAQPSGSFTAMTWFRAEPEQFGEAPWHHILCCWETAMVDPLRISIVDGALHVRIEQPAASFDLRGPQVADGTWRHVAVVKDNAELRVYIDGRYVQQTRVPETLSGQARVVGLGCNPLHSDIEGFHGDLAGVRLTACALTDGDIFRAAQSR
jgi:hypothetical protein